MTTSRSDSTGIELHPKCGIEVDTEVAAGTGLQTIPKGTSGEIKFDGISCLPRCSIINVPGTIMNMNVLIECMGGYEHVGLVCSGMSKETLSIDWDKDDPVSRFGVAERAPRFGLIIEKRTYATRCEYLLRLVCTSSYAINHLMDYHLAPEEAYRFPLDRISIFDQIHELKNERFRFSDVPRPPVFSRHVHAKPYKFKANSYKTSEYISSEFTDSCFQCDGKIIENSGVDFAIRDQAAEMNLVCRFMDAQVPTTPAYHVDSSNWGSSDKSLMTRVRQVFDERPLWTRLALMAQLDSSRVNQTVLKKILSQVVYAWVDGPWRGCMCRLGYDPRTDVASKEFQVIDFRDPYFRSLAQRSSTVDEPSGIEQDYQVNAAPSKPSVFYQLCDINDDSIKRVIGRSNNQERCTRSHGWFEKMVFDKIKDLLVVRTRMLRTAHDDISTNY